MEEAQPYIFKRLGFAQQTKYRLPRKSKYETSNVYSKYYKHFDNSTIKSLRQIYKNDIRIFGYPESPFD